MMREWGSFPFGRPNGVRPTRRADRADAVIIGVYPSAWHVTWNAPPRLVANGRRGRVAALAVDVEPLVFWDGSDDDFAARVVRWKHEVGFVDGDHGTVPATSPSTNGSSGDKVVQHYLRPLGLDAARVTFTDVYPVFLVKRSNGARREQGDAIHDEYDAIAAAMGRSVSSLPARIPSSKLPATAATAFGASLTKDLAEAAPSVVITLGEEVWNTLTAIPSLRARPPRSAFSDLYGDGYGAVGDVEVGGRKVAWLPLVHPGLLRGGLDPAAEVPTGPRTTDGWIALHARWTASVRRTNQRSTDERDPT